jgi:hypothetical protein
LPTDQLAHQILRCFFARNHGPIVEIVDVTDVARAPLA